MSIAIMNSMMPPASRKALSEMPNVRSSGSPSKAKNIRMPQATTRRSGDSVGVAAGAAGQRGEDRRAARRVDDHRRVMKAVVNSSITSPLAPSVHRAGGGDKRVPEQGWRWSSARRRRGQA